MPDTPNEKTTSPARLTDTWQRWIAENRLLEVPDEKIVEILVSRGVEENLAREAVAATAANPYFQAAERILMRYRKAESLLGVYSSLLSLSGPLQSLPYRLNLSRDEFLNEHYAANRPVVLTEAMRDWPALEKWTPEYLRSVCGEQMVEIMADRESDPGYEINAGQHRHPIRFDAFVDRILTSGPSNDYYLVANNHFFSHEATRALLDDFTPFPELLLPDKLTGVHFWFGPAGTVTPLHHDALNIIVAQVYGRKRFILISSQHLSNVYNHHGVYSEVDAGSPDFTRFPRYQQAKRIEVILEPGEALFLPVGWWHYVEALDISMTLSFTNFPFPNRYNWKHPQMEK